MGFNRGELKPFAFSSGGLKSYEAASEKTDEIFGSSMSLLGKFWMPFGRHRDGQVLYNSNTKVHFHPYQV
jgi:hypothetical protein